MVFVSMLLLAIGKTPPRPAALAVTGLLAIAMGAQAAAARHLAVKDISTVVITSVITGLAADSRLGGGTSQPWFRRVAALGLICAGAATGAVALRSHIALGVGLAAAITLGVAVLGHALEPHADDRSAGQ